MHACTIEFMQSIASLSQKQNGKIQHSKNKTVTSNTRKQNGNIEHMYIHTNIPQTQRITVTYIYTMSQAQLLIGAGPNPNAQTQINRGQFTKHSFLFREICNWCKHGDAPATVIARAVSGQSAPCRTVSLHAEHCYIMFALSVL